MELDFFFLEIRKRTISTPSILEYFLFPHPPPQEFAEFCKTGICKSNTNLLNALDNSSQRGLCIYFLCQKKNYLA